MPGTNERRSVVDDDGWEPHQARARARWRPLLIGFAVALVVVPLLAFFATLPAAVAVIGHIGA